MSIRLMGPGKECKAAITALESVFHVAEVSGPYANRGDSDRVRYFVETRGLRL
jgi:hypothetical protein